MPEEAAHPAPEQEEAAERDQVRVHDPRERLLRETEICANRREHNRDDRRVEDDHQIPKHRMRSASQRLSVTSSAPCPHEKPAYDQSG